MTLTTTGNTDQKQESSLQEQNSLQISVREGKAKLRAEDFKNPEYLSNLIHKIGHEIGNPLTSIISMATVLESLHESKVPNVAGKEKQFRYINAIADEAWRISRLNERLVMLFSSRAGSVSGCDIIRVSDKALSKLKSRYKESFKAVSVVFEVPEICPLVKIDEMQLLLVFTELFHNAKDAVDLKLQGEQLYRHKIEKQQVTIGVNINVGWDNDQSKEFAQISFSSNCMNPCPLELDTLFCPDVTGYPMYKRLGLGLPVCQAIIERVGGDMKVIEEICDNEIVFSVKFSIPITTDK